MQPPLKDLLAGSQLFGELAPNELDAVARAAETREFARDETIFAMALKLAAGFQPMSAAEAEAIKTKGLAAKPLFKYPSEQA